MLVFRFRRDRAPDPVLTLLQEVRTQLARTADTVSNPPPAPPPAPEAHLTERIAALEADRAALLQRQSQLEGALAGWNARLVALEQRPPLTDSSVLERLGMVERVADAAMRQSNSLKGKVYRVKEREDQDDDAPAPTPSFPPGLLGIGGPQ